MPNLAVDVDSWARSACYPRSTFYPLSDGPPTWGRRITRADFRPCSTRGWLSVGAGGLSLDPSQTARKFSQDVGGATSVVVTHNLNSTAVVVQAVEKASKNLVSCDVQITSANTVTVGFAVAPAAGAITVTVVG